MKGGTAIQSWTFTNCSALEKINFPDTLTSVTGNYVFYNCDALTYLYFPASVTKIGGDCLAAYCDKLKTVCIANPECELPAYNGYDLGTVGQTTIYGESNSTAKTYATAKGYAFKTLDAAPAAPADPVISDNPSAPQFKDVASDAYYADAVAWAVANNITAGTSNTTFSPNQACTRAQAVTFLWRAAGEPEPTRTSNPFRDVSSGQYYYKAVLWAVEEGVTSGMSATSFAPNQTCTRAQIVTFQWRAAGEPTATGSNAFKDVANSAYYASAVRWAVKNGVTTGTSTTTFSPDAACTRAQIVTFLHRAEG